MNNPLRVLIAEDSEDDALLLVRELKNAGFDPIFRRIETAGEMKAALNAQTWDIVFADYTMSHFGGLAALKILKESGLDLPFIIVSGTIGEDVAVGAMKAGVHGYVMKNNLARLVPAIERELRDALARQERKKAEGALKDSEEKYRTLVNHSLQGIVVAQGPSPRLVFVNPAMSRILGYTTDELLSLSSKELENLVHAEDREFFFKNFRDRLEEKEVPQNYEIRGIRKDGSVCWLAISGNRIEYKGKPAVQAAFIDITERKQAEKAFKESERFSWAVLETAPSLIVLTDAEGHIFLFNRACEELTGYKREEVVGKTIPELFLPPEWVPIVQKRFADPYAPEVRVPHENPWRTKSGEERLIEWRCTVLPSPVDGSPHILGTGIDITERKKAEEALRSEKTWSEAIVSSAPNIVVGLGKGSKILIFNKFAEELTGFRAEEVVGKPWLEIFIPEEMRGQLYGVWDEIVKNKLIEHYYENTIVTKQGDKRIISWNNTVLTQDGEFRMVLSIGDDITERKRAEEAVKESEERYRNLFENAIDGIALADAETGILIDCNKAIENLVNRERAELIGQSQQILHPPEDNIGEVSRSFAQHRLDKKGQLLETQVITKAGERKHVEIKANIIELKRGRVLQGIFRDITQRKRAEEALHESEKRYRGLFDGMPIGLYRTNTKGEILDVNPALVEMLGYPDRESLSKVKAVDTDADPEERKRWLTLMEQQGIVRGFQRQLRRRDGSVIWVEENARVFRDAESKGLYHYEGSFQDITERKQMEEALRQAEERYRSIFENAVEGIFQATLEGRYLSANPAQARILGYESPEELATSVTDITNQLFAEPERRREIVRLLKEHGVVTRFEFQAYRKDGSKIWILSNVRAVHDATGAVIYHEGTIQDITDRKRAEESLKQSEENAKQLAQENATMAEIGRIISSTLDIDEIYESFSKEARKLISFDRVVINMIDTEKGTVRNAYIAGKGLQDRDVKDVYPLEGSGNAEMVRTKSTLLIQTEGFNEYRDRFPTLLSTFQAGFRSIMNVPLFSKGKIIGGLLLRSREPYAYTDKDVKLAERIGSQIAGAIANAQLFIERKQAEEALRQSEEKYRTILENIEDGYLEVDLAGNFTFANNAECRNLGYTSEELIGMNYRRYTDETTARKLYQTFNGVNRTGESVKVLDVEVIRKDGTRVINEISVSLIRDSKGRPIGFRGISRDITERKRAEEERLALQEQFRQSQKMEAVGKLAGGVAHDFNNLLTIIKGNSELSLMDLGKDDPIRENLEGVLRASGRASDLIRQLLAFSRRQILEMRVLDLNSLLMDLDKMLHRLIGEDIELVTLPCKDLGRIKADAGQIEQVILNLAVNSRDAMPSGGRLTIETANVELDETYARRHVAVIPGRYVMLSVSDTGAGMTPEVTDRVFEPFFTTKDKGTGLGLSTVYGIVKQSGGNIWVYSEPGKGTTFKIYLPRIDEPLEEVVREKAAEDGLPRGSETILIVEDEEDVREVAVRVLKMQGYRVLEASNGSDALQHSEHEAGPIHLMVTDVVMPGMNGPELAKRLNPLRPDMKVLYISGYTDNAIVHHGVLEKGVNYIQKPFTVEGLARKVREVLDR